MKIKLNVFSLISILIILFAGGVSAQIPCVSGFVTDPNGNPVIDADLDFDDAITGERIFTPGDNTDNSGFYTVCVFPGIYNISFAPPPGSNLLGMQFFNVDLTSGSPLTLDVTLDFGVVISGTISDSLGNPVNREIDLDADNLTTGQRIYTPNDNSDSLTGAYWIVVPPDNYRIRFQPPQGSRWLGLQIDSLAVPTNTTLNVVLNEGFLLSGTVTDDLSVGIPNVSVDLRDQLTGNKLYVPNNKTDSLGSYTVAVPAGMFELRFVPVAGSRYVGVAIDSFTIAGDMIHNQVLTSGYIFTATVHDSLSNPIPGADLDFIMPGTGEKIFTPFDKTDSLGVASFAVLPDTYNIRVQPPLGTLFDKTILDSVIISSDTTFDFLLVEVQRVHLTGRVTDTSGTGLVDIGINLLNQTTGTPVYSVDKTTDTLGFYNIRVPLGIFDLVFIPPRGERYVALKIPDITFTADTLFADIALESGYLFEATVYNEIAEPMENIDFDFSVSGSAIEVFTPHDISDSSGTIQAALPGDLYSIVLNPPAGSGLQGQQLDGFEVLSDTSIFVIMHSQSPALPESFLLEQNAPNPFNSSTTISYFLLEESRVEISIYDGLGRWLRTFKEGIVYPGKHGIIWDGTDRGGNTVSSGVYFYRLKTSFGDKTKKMLFIK